MSLSVDVRARRGDLEIVAGFEAGAGETIALLGPNGSGKSTIVAILAGLLVPAAGRVTLGELVLDDPAKAIHLPAERRRVGVVFQDRLLFPHLSALENAAFPLRAAGHSKLEARERARVWLERLGVAARSSARPRDLSGGEAQRVALARALVAEPQLLLLDEPLSAMDVRSRTEIRDLVRRTLASFGGARVLVTHDPVDAMTLADRIVLLERGHVTQLGTPEEIRDAPRTPYAAELVGLNLFVGRLERLGEDEGAGRLVTPAGDLTVAWPDDADDAIGGGDGVIGLLRPADVALHLERPEGSPRNVLRGRVESISFEGERARARIASHPPLVAEVTLGSVQRLGLAEGTPVWASFKAVEVRVVLP